MFYHIKNPLCIKKSIFFTKGNWYDKKTGGILSKQKLNL